MKILENNGKFLFLVKIHDFIKILQLLDFLSKKSSKKVICRNPLFYKGKSMKFQ